MNRRRIMPLALPLLLVACIFAGSWLMRGGGAPRAAAAPLSVYYVAPGGDDSNSCLAIGTPCATIGAAVDKAGNGDTIEIAAGTYYENNIEISEELTLNGAGAAQTVVDGQNNGRLFALYVDVTLSNMTLQNGETPDDANIFNSGGGALLTVGGQIHLQQMVIRDSSAASSGGAIFNLAQLTISDSEIISNTAAGAGGGVYNYSSATGVITMTTSLLAYNEAQTSSGGGVDTNGPLTMIDSEVRGNRAPSYLGGGLSVSNADLLLDGVTVTGNEATAGSALFMQIGGVATIENSTISGNVASNNYAGLYGSGAVAFEIAYSTIAYNTRTNTAGVGYNGIAAFSGAEATIVGSIIANNADRQCYSDSTTSAGYNMASDTYCSLTATGDQPSTDPLLLALGDYGGPTPTHTLAAGSPAIDAGDVVNCPAEDQRGVARPVDGDNSGMATCDIGAVEMDPQLSIAGVSQLEGTGGTTTAVFEVTLSPVAAQTVTVDFATANGTATAPADYAATSGTLTFNAGESLKTIAVDIVSDGDDEPDETFQVLLSNATNAGLLVSSATGTIVDDDGLPSLTIDDVTMLEGDAGSQPFTFEVTLSPSSGDVVTVDYTTVDGTAAAGSDFTATSGTLTFAAGETSKLITVDVLGDMIDEGSAEAFAVQLSGAVNATVVDGSGAGTITDDDTARMSHGFGPTVVEGDSGTRPATFTVTLSLPASFPITVDYLISSGCCDDGATAGVDFVGTFSGTLTFAPGETVVNYSVNVVGDHEVEPDERFSSLLSNASVPLSANTSTGVILNDDAEDEERWLYLPVILGGG